MPSIRLRVDSTYRRLYDQRSHHSHSSLPSITTVLPTGILQESPTPRPSLTQPTDYAPPEFPVVEQMPFKPNYRAFMAWNMADTTLVLLVVALGVILGVFYPAHARGFDDNGPDAPPRWEDDLTPEVAAAMERDAAERAARNQRLTEEGYETDREDN
ncbi:uncharacterized protein BKCO1_6400012 [Diplodia corticola]|uniref:Uncharacterized protein n=1 Tax=Diplodia corticola TaxID=236234 RepID=A0A1J9QP59_9PEZI|nr:uncharacterized protein BKCO1_6400012 [Diplodia corticola]OJD30232.1 hypothetical protein BKCO1_6400012 [Diplodia corticola]